MVLMLRGLIIVGLTLGLYQQGDPLTDIAQLAASAYDSENYEVAQAQYEALILSGVRDSAVYINLGHTYYQLRDWGRALVNYRRAQVIQPRDAQISASLARVRALRTDIQGDETALIDSIAALTIPVVTNVELTAIVSGLWGLFFSFVFALIVRRSARDSLRGVLILLLVLLLFSLTLWASRVYVDRFRLAAVVIEVNAPVMSGPGDEYLEINTLHTATELRVLEQRGEWVRFILPDARQGWIQAGMIEVI